MDAGRASGSDLFLRLPESIAVDDRRMGVFDADFLACRALDGLDRVLVDPVEDEHAGIGLVAQDVVDRVDLPKASAPRPDSVLVEDARDLLRALVLKAQPEHPADHRSFGL